MLFTDFADNTLAREELHALTGHLLDCQACALEWREFQQTLTLLHGLETKNPPADLLPGIHAKLAKRGIFDRAWAIAETLNFSLSIPAAATIFTIAMLAGFLLKNSPSEQTGFFQSNSARISASNQGALLAASRPPVVPSVMFAVSHDGWRRGRDMGPLVRTALAPHPDTASNTNRLWSPDIHVLIENIDPESRVALCRKILRHNWQIHHMTGSLFLVHLPQADLEAFHEILDRHRFAMMPAAAAETGFAHDKKVLTAVIRFQ